MKSSCSSILFDDEYVDGPNYDHIRAVAMKSSCIASNLILPTSSAAIFWIKLWLDLKRFVGMMPSCITSYLMLSTTNVTILLIQTMIRFESSA